MNARALQVSNLRLHEAEKRAAAATRKLLLRERQHELDMAAAAAASRQQRWQQKRRRARRRVGGGCAAARDAAAAEAEAQLQEVREMYAALRELQSTIEEERDAAEEKAAAAVGSLKAVVGIDIDRNIPDRKFEGDPTLPTAKSAWGKRVSKHVTAVLKGGWTTTTVCETSRGRCRAPAAKRWPRSFWQHRSLPPPRRRLCRRLWTRWRSTGQRASPSMCGIDSTSRSEAWRRSATC